MNRLVGASLLLLILVVLTGSSLAGPAVFAAFENGHSVRVEEGQGMLFVFEKGGTSLFLDEEYVLLHRHYLDGRRLQDS